MPKPKEAPLVFCPKCNNTVVNIIIETEATLVFEYPSYEPVLSETRHRTVGKYFECQYRNCLHTWPAEDNR